MMMNGLTKYASDWFARGDDDLALVELVLEKKTGSANLACFHLQQAAEKYLKGFLAHRDLHVRKIHDLETLLEDCKIVDADFVQLQDDMRLLNRFYTESRYPDDYIEFSWQDVESAYAAILRIKEFVMQKIQSSDTSGGFGLLGIIIALAVVVLAGGGGLYWKETRNKKSLLQTSSDAIQQAEELKAKIEGQNDAVADKSAVDTSDWKTYRNEIYGYEISYPQDYTLYVGSGGVVNPRMIIIHKAKNASAAGFGTGLNQFRIQLARFSSFPDNKFYNIRYLLEEAKKEHRTEADKIVKREVKEILRNGLAGFRVASEDEITHPKYTGPRTWMLNVEAFLASTYEDTEYLMIDAKDANPGSFTNKEERDKLSPEINLFDEIIATIKFIK